jgi:Ran GTPase-activating protein (RanGAP) involved in mRNA processing and transport
MTTPMTNNNKKQLIHPNSLEALRILCKADLNVKKKLLGDNNYDEEESNARSNDYDVAEVSFWSPHSLQVNDEGHIITLELSGRRIKKLPREAFALLKKLQILNLGGTDVPISQLTSALEECCSSTQLEKLYLGGNGLRDSGVQAICSCIQSQSRCPIKRLDFRYNDIGISGAAAIADILVKNANNVTYLYLEGNQIGDDGAVALAAAIQDPKLPLQELFLGGNQIGPFGASNLAQALETNTSLQKLYLEGNCIGPEGAASFTSILKHMGTNTHLKHLYVDNNGIGKEETIKLARALNCDTVIGDVL